MRNIEEIEKETEHRLSKEAEIIKKMLNSLGRLESEMQASDMLGIGFDNTTASKHLDDIEENIQKLSNLRNEKFCDERT